ncbi:hypothetical protein L249_2096 [Ophiocordyceps polyrhachis-furcata BCC 54312]|uniref:Uncharacterized protein n=1 Tax=Ophiocordyceps polyrhachis-furcata BCC 54312 TaxID=1330021 RepID=A0A367LSL4_9HYPO|nr:hypothetical protein L249_2096 [Ophiocordyceps polyrhachis-furcata BCC 54312]
MASRGVEVGFDEEAEMEEDCVYTRNIVPQRLYHRNMRTNIVRGLRRFVPTTEMPEEDSLSSSFGQISAQDSRCPC